MLPGKKYKPEDLLRILWRRRWLLLVPCAVVSAGTAVYVRYLPDRYLSEALVQVQPQQVPESFVRSTVTTDVEDRLRAIRENVMSRTRLERVILEFNLYAEARKTGIMQDIVERMQRDVTVVPGRGGDSFRVGFLADNAVTARKVAEKITSMFIDESVKQRSSLAEGTNQFLEAQLEEARGRLIEQEKKVEAYRRQYGPELPTQLDSNMQAISNVQMQIQQLLQAINQNQQRRLLLERQLVDLENEPAPAVAAPVATPTSPEGTAPPMTAAEQLAVAQAQLAAMSTRLTAEHPDIGRMKRAIAELQTKADVEALRVPLSGPDAGASPAMAARQRRIADLRRDLDQLSDLITKQQVEEQRLRATAGVYQQRVEAAPTREVELIELTRDYGTQQDLYASLLKRREDARIAANLERRQIGETFSVIDPARLPERPISPDRQLLNTMGIAAGLGLGLALIALLEYRDATFKTDEEVSSVLGLPVLAIVPLMRSDAEKRRARWRTAVVTVVLGTTVAVCFAVVTYTFVR
jgi:polysaccharide chain length determinant protein (PEP-CTERM system associated)